MIKWYDYLAAVIIADIITSIILIAITTPLWWLQLLIAFCAWFIFDLWDLYCILRLKSEIEKK